MATNRGAKVLHVEDAEPLSLAGDAYRLLADSRDTDGRYMMLHAEVPPGGGPRRHVHSLEDEGFFVIEGEITFEADGETVFAGPGTFLNLPPGVPHFFRNRSDAPARMLIFCAPGGIEQFFRAAGALGSEVDKSPSRIVRLADKYGISFV